PLCPDVPEERRLRMVAHLARILEGGHFPPGMTELPLPTYQVPTYQVPVGSATADDPAAGEGVGAEGPVPPEIG
ncbi:MAG TPA: hypothetical protein VKY26_11630, partial [Actinomycetota bacterium]|nr:hypothetical protein [Actinomycetota bacterium]